MRQHCRERETCWGWGAVKKEQEEGGMSMQGVGKLQGANYFFCFWQMLHSILIIFGDSYYVFHFRVGEMDTSPWSYR